MKKQRNSLLVIKNTLLFLLIFLCIAGCGSISDGEYAASVVLSGGSGRAYIESPCRVTMKNGKATADIVWSSPNYDYMIVGGETYYPVNTEGNSEFIIPIELDKELPVQADTVAMSTPHLIDYSLKFTLEDEAGKSDENTSLSEASEVFKKDSGLAENREDMEAPDIEGLTYVSTDENSYAECFKIHRYSEGFGLIAVDDGRKYLVVPEGKDAPSDLNDIIVLKQPLDRIYLAASSVMCQFDSVSAIENIILSGLDRDGWYIDSAIKAMDEGKLIYGGKYSAPDYERMVLDDINLAIESTMILHAPKVQEKIEQLGIPIFIDRSSYESDPLGRCEWVKVYGVITGKEAEADSAYKEQEALVKALDNIESENKTVAVFSINSNHQIVTRRKNDYFAKMIEMAGGEYLAPVENDDESGNSQMTISIEDFYDYAENADILIYNATIESEPESLEGLMNMDVIFPKLRAFKEGNVWYMDKSFYQFANKTGTIIENINRILTEDGTETEFLHLLK